MESGTWIKENAIRCILNFFSGVNELKPRKTRKKTAQNHLLGLQDREGNVFNNSYRQNVAAAACYELNNDIFQGSRRLERDWKVFKF